ncbi:MAG: hypothetical protein NT062_10740, partial [Proteobacteria bacterium]|nr:hypothetical protein [Pseudomonadota bacterium]
AYSHLALGTPVARVARTGPNNTDYTVEFQAHGLADNLLAAVDGSGGVRVGLVHTPFGSTIEATDVGGTTGLAGHPRRMNDKYTDDLSGLAYYGARYYDRSSMTWTQGDPLYRFTPEAAWASPRRSSLYTMSLNNPLRYLDPDGKDPEGAWLRSQGYWRNNSPRETGSFRDNHPIVAAVGMAVAVVAVAYVSIPTSVAGLAVGAAINLGSDQADDTASSGIDAKDVVSAIVQLTIKVIESKLGFRGGGPEGPVKGTAVEVAESAKASRPAGVPANWIEKPSKTGGGTRFVDPKNPHNSVRVMPGDPESAFPNSQVPYVRHLNNGQSLDVDGKVVSKYTPDAHIPLKDFKLK